MTVRLPRWNSAPSLQRVLLIVALVSASAVGSLGCKKEPTRWDVAVDAATSGETPATTVVKTEGSALNKFFPAEVDGASRVFTQEKPGFVEAQLKKDSAVVATLAISDTEGDANAKKKFDGAADQVGGVPLVTVGKNQSAALVGRYQVKVSSPTLDAPARKAILERFDLKGLAKL